MDRQTHLRNAAIVHACIPHEFRRVGNDPLLTLVPDGAIPDDAQYDHVEAITGKPFDREFAGGPIPENYVMPARVRSVLTRWAMQQPGVHEDREHVRAREMWKVVTADR